MVAGGDFRIPPIESFIRGDAMRKTLTIMVAAATFAVAAIAAPGTAAARWGWRGGMVYYDYLAPAPMYYDYRAPSLFYDYDAPASIYYNYYTPAPHYGCW